MASAPHTPCSGGLGKSRCLLPGCCAGGPAELCVSRNGDAGPGAWVKGGRLHTEAASQGPRGPGTRPDGETEAPSPSWAGPTLVSTPGSTSMGKDQGQAEGQSSACPAAGSAGRACVRGCGGGGAPLLAGREAGPLPTAAQCGLRGAWESTTQGCSCGQSETALSAFPTHSAQRSPLMLGLSGTICRRGAKHALPHLPKHVFRLASHLRRAPLDGPSRAGLPAVQAAQPLPRVCLPCWGPGTASWEQVVP